MAEDRSVVAVYETDEQAQMGYESVRETGIAAEQITVVGAGESGATDAFAGAESPTAKGAGRGALLGGIVGAVVTLAIPGVGVVLASGLLAAGAVSGAGLGMLAEVGVPTANVKDYEEDLADGRYLVVVHGSAEDVERAHDALYMTDTEELDRYV